jgi:DNA-binding NtrC family response regulator
VGEGQLQAMNRAVRFVTKPFQFDEAQARVETHIKLQRAQQGERRSPEKTLSGAVRPYRLVHLTAPALAAIGGYPSIVAHVTQNMAIGESRQ